MGAFILSLVIISSFFLPVTDETNWAIAGGDFAKAIVELRPDKTYIPEVSHRLGVSVLWISSAIYLVSQQPYSPTLLFIHRMVFLLINLGLFFVALKIIGRYFSDKYLLLFVLYTDTCFI